MKTIFSISRISSGFIYAIVIQNSKFACITVSIDRYAAKYLLSRSKRELYYKNSWERQYVIKDVKKIK